MTDAVYVHIGPHKTGTTFLQQVLEGNKDALARRGVLFPGADYGAQTRGVLNLLERRWQGRPDVTRVRWSDLVQEIHAWRGHSAVLSHEALSTARPPVIGRLVRTLRPCEVHMVYTARDLSRVIPAMWQTHMRNRGRTGWDGFLASVRGDAGADSGLGNRFWRAQDPRQILPRWATQVPAERIHVVTVPPTGVDPAVLWTRFAAVTGLDADAYSLQVRRRNESLGPAESEVLRRLNQKVADAIGFGTYQYWVKGLAAHHLEERAAQQKFGLPAEEYPWVQARTKQIIAFLEQEPYDITGDLADLMPTAPTGPVVRPDAADSKEALDAATDAIAEMLRRLDRISPEGTWPKVQDSRWSTAAGRVRLGAERARRWLADRRSS